MIMPTLPLLHAGQIRSKLIICNPPPTCQMSSCEWIDYIKDGIELNFGRDMLNV